MTTKTKNAPESLAWLMTRTRRGLRRIQTLGWGKLARIHSQGDRNDRSAIEREARRCGYEPATILGLNSD